MSDEASLSECEDEIEIVFLFIPLREDHKSALIHGLTVTEIFLQVCVQRAHIMVQRYINLNHRLLFLVVLKLFLHVVVWFPRGVEELGIRVFESIVRVSLRKVDDFRVRLCKSEIAQETICLGWVDLMVTKALSLLKHDLTIPVAEFFNAETLDAWIVLICCAAHNSGQTVLGEEELGVAL